MQVIRQKENASGLFVISRSGCCRLPERGVIPNQLPDVGHKAISSSMPTVGNVTGTFELADSLVVSVVGTQPSVIRMKETFKTWWDGTYSPHENYPGSALIFTTGTARRSWSCRQRIGRGRRPGSVADLLDVARPCDRDVEAPRHGQRVRRNATRSRFSSPVSFVPSTMAGRA
jgi:hypothetical protein